jgi:hypothetical protein
LRTPTAICVNEPRGTVSDRHRPDERDDRVQAARRDHHTLYGLGRMRLLRDVGLHEEDGPTRRPDRARHPTRAGRAIGPQSESRSLCSEAVLGLRADAGARQQRRRAL